MTGKKIQRRGSSGTLPVLAAAAVIGAAVFFLLHAFLLFIVALALAGGFLLGRKYGNRS